MNGILPLTPNILPAVYSPAGEGALPLKTATPYSDFRLPDLTQIPTMEKSAVDSSSEPSTWGHMVQRMVTDVNESQATAASKIQDVLAGGKTQVHDAMISFQEASVKFEMLTQIRNKALDAYQEIMRMQV